MSGCWSLRWVALIAFVVSCRSEVRPTSESLKGTTVPKPRAENPISPLRDAAPPTEEAKCAEVIPNEARALRLREFIPVLEKHLLSFALQRYRTDAETFAAEKGLNVEKIARDYALLRALLELTRDGGSWGIRWQITNKEPTSREIWKTWSVAFKDAGRDSRETAIAECDEVSALFAFLARNMGVGNVGLYWPTWNHTIAMWEPADKVRVLIPTTQIFLDCDATFGRVDFQMKTSRHRLSPFPANDARANTLLPASLVAFLLDRADTFGPASEAVQSYARIVRGTRSPSSHRRSCASGKERPVPEGCADKVALRALEAEESLRP